MDAQTICQTNNCSLWPFIYGKERRGDPNFRFILHLLEEPSAAFDDEGTELRGIGGGLNAFSQNQ